MADEEPKPSGNLTGEQRQKILEWSRTKAVGPLTCSVCNTQSWQVLPNLVAPINLTAKLGLQLGGQISPCFGMVCKNCGHTVFVNAIVAGVLPKEQKTEEPEK